MITDGSEQNEAQFSRLCFLRMLPLSLSQFYLVPISNCNNFIELLSSDMSKTVSILLKAIQI